MTHPTYVPRGMRAGVINTMQPARVSSAPRAGLPRTAFTKPLGLPDDATDAQILDSVSAVIASNKRARAARAEQAAEDALYAAFFGSSESAGAARPQSAASSSITDEALYTAAFGDDHA